MPESASTIKYWIGQHDGYPLYYGANGEKTGAWTEFAAELSKLAGRDTELVTMRDGQAVNASEALDMLACGELDLVLGMPREMWERSEAAKSGEGAGWTASCGIYRSELTGYILKDSPQAGERDFENCYWAIDSALKDMLQNTAFDGHTVDFADRMQLYEALEKGDVYGVIDTRSGFDYAAFVGHSFKYGQCAAVSIPYTECAYVRTGDEELLAFVNEACDNTAGKLRTRLDIYGHADGATVLERGYVNLLAESEARASGYETASFALGGATIVLAVICAVLAGKLRMHRKLEEAKLRTLLAENSTKELLELDLRGRVMRSYNNFAIFGERGRELPNPVKLSELSELLGYDFAAHYGNVSTHISRRYTNRLIIHVGGEKLYIAEEGVRIGKTLMLTMTKM